MRKDTYERFFKNNAFEDKFEVYHLSKSCVIGKEVCNGVSIGNTASDLWNDVFASGSIEVRMTLTHILNHSTYGWTCDYDAETDIAPADTPCQMDLYIEIFRKLMNGMNKE